MRAQGEGALIDYNSPNSWAQRVLLAAIASNGRTNATAPPLDRNTEAAILKPLIAAAGVVSTAVTHIFRECPAAFLYNMGTPGEQIGNLGVWEGMSKLERHYLWKNLPLIAMYTMAGFPGDNAIAQSKVGR